jgi:hypothetical protein
MGVAASLDRSLQPGDSRTLGSPLQETFMTISPSDLSASLARARGEYLEMPGLSMTVAQASRLWNVPEEVAEAILAKLVDSRFLQRRNNGVFVRASDGVHQRGEPMRPDARGAEGGDHPSSDGRAYKPPL